MAVVKVVLKQDVVNLGQTGEVKQVAPGYFRNFLLPRGLAIEATKGQLRSLEANATSRASQNARARGAASSLSERLSSLTLSIPVKLGEQGRIYGSVTNKDISEALEAQGNVTIDRHDIDLKEPLKSIGEHTVPVKLPHGVGATLRVELVPDEETLPAT